MIRTTQTNGNAANRICGSRLRVWVDDTLVGHVVVPHASAKYYIQKHPGGKYAARYRELWAEALALEAARKEAN